MTGDSFLGEAQLAQFPEFPVLWGTLVFAILKTLISSRQVELPR